MGRVENQHKAKLVGKDLAARLRLEIIIGVIRPGDRIFESKCASKFKTSHAAFREAVKILDQEGFITKKPGQAGRVSRLSDKDVANVYQIRSAVEGLAARLATRCKADLSPLQQAVHCMRDSLAAGDRDALLENDCRFHLRLCEASGNKHLEEYSHRIILPFFAYVRIHAAARWQEASVWAKDLEVHQKIVDLIEAGDSSTAEQFIHCGMSRFEETAYHNWLGIGLSHYRRSVSTGSLAQE